MTTKPASPVEQPAAAPISLEGLRRTILTPRAIMRDEDGMVNHPAVPALDEDVNYETFFAAFGIESVFIHMENDVDCDTYEKYFASNSPDCSMWTPSSPHGDGWLLLEIYDTEDGPVALYVREKKPESMRDRRKREEQERRAAAPSPADERAALMCERLRAMDLGTSREAADLIEELAARAASATETGAEGEKPTAWVRFRSDGGFEGPIMDSDERMCDTRRKSGAWTPLYGSPAMAVETVEWRELTRRLYVELFYCDQQMTGGRRPKWTQGAEVRDALRDAKAALEAAPQPAQATYDGNHVENHCTECGQYESECACAQADAREGLTEPHSDDVAVDSFAAVMKHKLALARDKGRSGWETCSPAYLSRMLHEHVEKGDPRDVANLSMMLWHHGSPITRPAAHPGEPEPRAEVTPLKVERHSDMSVLVVFSSCRQASVFEKEIAARAGDAAC
ncbi:hypothetical protein [Burkholderia sp. BCC1644]|uniref:hypothetical protein n=1 Tax=Burkholderia sp. BCC1644 TaxID=2676293 RepID=UPI0015921804|nr:hypothetical protein [Burkholderia sp. BCC1644]